MSGQLSPFESLPNELLDYIIYFLSTSPPSHSRLHFSPSRNIAASRTKDLKNVSRVSSRFFALVRPHLFSHACFDLGDEGEFLSFITESDLARYVTSIVVTGNHSPDQRDDAFWWRRVLCDLDPLKITVVAPPVLIGGMLGAKILEGHSWAFDIPLQVLHLEQASRQWDLGQSSQLERQSSILSARPWTTWEFNESSSLRAYNHYEYFLFRIPSVLDKWGSLAAAQPNESLSPMQSWLGGLTSFRYTAVFPFYNHVKLVLDVVNMMTNLETFSIQLAPDPSDKVKEMEQKGSMDPSDPWMELTTGYSLIAHTVLVSGSRHRLRRFIACDYQWDALRVELAGILSVLETGGWIQDGDGTWTKPAEASSLVGTDISQVI